MEAATSMRKRIVEAYFDGFRGGDHAAILACLTDDVVWHIVGFKTLRGKAEFDSEIENDRFEGHPELTVDRLVEEGHSLVALGSGLGRMREGGELRFAFCTAFELTDADAIAQVTSYIVPLDGAAP
jgi:ketosteroid isomerase-like protein